MPSGSKKRKASKKPKPGEPPSAQGEPPELEIGSEESMGKDWEETLEGSPSPKATDVASEESMGKDWEEAVEGSPSPKAMDVTSEAVVEVGVDQGKELIREASQEESEVAEASAPDHPVELEPEVPNWNEVGRADLVNIKRGDPSPQIREEIEIPFGETEPEIDAPPAENKPEVEADTGTTGLEHDRDYAGVPPIGIALAAADETEQRELAPNEMEAEPHESLLEVKRIADVARDDTGPEDDKTAPDIFEVRFEGGVDEEAAEMDAAPGDAQPENDEDTLRRDLDTHAASANNEPDDTPVETVEDLVEDQPEIDETVVNMQPLADAVAGNFEMDPWMDKAPVDAEPEIDENFIGREVDADTPSAIIEPAASDDVLYETAAETDKDPADVQSELEEVMEQSQPETDAVPRSLEPEPTAERDSGKETTQVGEDASAGEEVEPNGPRVESQKGYSEGEIEANMDVASAEVEEAEPEATMREVDSETEFIVGEIKPEMDATLDDITDYDEGAQADIKPEPEESASVEVGPEVEVENDYSSLETAADALKIIDPELERFTNALDKTEGRTISEVEEILLEANTQPAQGTSQKFELEHEAEPADDALMEASEVSGSKEDINQGATEPEAGSASVYEPAAEAITDVEAEPEVPELEPEVEVPSESKLDQEGPFETDLDQPDLTQIEPDQAKVEDNDQQIPQQEREADSGVETPELPGGETEQEELPATNEAGLGDGSALRLLDGDALATGIPAIEQEKAEEGEVISPPEEGLTDGGGDEEQGPVSAQLDESKEYSVEQERVDVDDIFGDQEEALSTEVHRSVVPSEQDTDVEEPPAMTVDEEVSLGEEPHAAATEESQPTLDDEQELTIDPSTIDMPQDESEMAEQGLRSTLPLGSEGTAKEYDPQNEVDVQIFDSSSGDAERDAGDEDAALSTVAEAGSVINEFDERASYQQLPVEFPSSEQDADFFESRVSDNTLSLQNPELQIDNNGRKFVHTSSPRAPELVGTGLTDQVGGGEHADSSWEDGSKVSGDSPKDEVEWKAAQDFEPIGVHADVSPIPDKEITIVEAGDGEEDWQGEVPPAFDDIRTVEGNESKAAAASQGEVLKSTFSNGDPLLSGSKEKDKQAFRQQNTQQASLPVILPPQDAKQRALVQGNLKSDEHARGGGTLQRRTNWLGCCGMFDLLVGKNK